MAHHIQGIHYSDEAFNVVKGRFPSYSRKQSHPAEIWALNQLELWILWNAGFLPLNEREWNQERMCWHFSFPRSILFFQNILSLSPRSSSSCWEAPLYPTPMSPTYLSHHQPINPMPIVTNRSTPGPSSLTHLPHAHRRQAIRHTPWNNAPPGPYQNLPLQPERFQKATRVFKTLPPTPTSKWLQTSAAKAFSWTSFKQELSES